MMEEWDLDVLGEMSGDYSGSNQETTMTDDLADRLPAYLSYLSLGFKATSTMFTVLMAGWIIVTIKTTRSLHKTHNIYVAYLLGIDAIFAFTNTLLSSAMIIGYFTGVGDFIGCNVFVFMLYPIGVIYFTFLTMSIDKVIAVTFPFKHRKIMKPRAVFGIIVTKHILAALMFVKYLFTPHSFIKVAQFGTCTGDNDSLIIIMLSMFLSGIITVTLDVYLTIKACLVYKKIQEESKLSGGHGRNTDQLKTLKKEQVSIKKHLKPIRTLMVVVMGNSLFGLMLPILYFSATLLESPVILSVLSYIITPNIGYIIFPIHPFAYALYFKQVREPMMSLLKRITCPCKRKSVPVAPQPQRNRINWLNPIN